MAENLLGDHPARWADRAVDFDQLKQEVEARHSDRERFDRFVRLAGDAQDKMGYTAVLDGDRVAREAMDLCGVLSDPNWHSRLDALYLTSDQKRQIRETTYVTLVSLADYGVRWKGDPASAAASLELLDLARSFHAPTRAFWFVRRESHRLLKRDRDAEEDDKHFQAAAAKTAWDYYLPGHTAGWRGDAQEAIRSYRAALRIQPNHGNSLFFLAMTLAGEKINRVPEAAELVTDCIAVQPGHVYAYLNRAGCYEKLGDRQAAEADYAAALAAARDDRDRYNVLRPRRK